MEFNLFSSIMVILYAETCNQTHTIQDMSNIIDFYWMKSQKLGKLWINLNNNLVRFNVFFVQWPSSKIHLLCVIFCYAFSLITKK